MKYDVTIIGGGPAGYVAAIRAAQLGLSACLIEKDQLGGVCLNWGCIPTKALLKSAELFDLLKKTEKFGIKVESCSFDIKSVVENSRSVSDRLRQGVEMLMKKNKITVIKGDASFTDNSTINIKCKDGSDQVINSKYFVIATGATARKIDKLNYDENFICTSRGAMVPQVYPKNITIIGGGVIGIEFASFYNSMGSDVTILEIGDQILQTEDIEIAAMANKTFASNGIKIICKASDIDVKQNTVSYTHNGKKIEHTTDKVIISIGVIPNSQEINKKKKIDLTLEKSGHIKVNDFLQTNIKNIYAVGDVTTGPALAHKASHEGIIAIENIAIEEGKLKQNKSKKPDPLNIPSCIYSSPQIASIGISESAAKQKGLNYRVGRFTPVGNGKAIASHDTNGIIKTIFEKETGEILGVHMLGSTVTEMIHSYAVAKTSELTDKDIIHTVFPHPTLSEMIHESALDAFERKIHG